MFTVRALYCTYHHFKTGLEDVGIFLYLWILKVKSCYEEV